MKKDENEPQFIALSKTDQYLLEAYEQAKSTLPYFFKLKESPEHEDSINAVKVKVYDIKFSEELGEDRFVYLWFYNVHKVDDTYMGILIQLPEEGINDMKTGEYINFSEDLIYDWMIMKDGDLHGGYTIRVVRDAKKTEAEKKHYDEQIGVKVYKPLPNTG